jgi:alkylhydroperoxidase family enzyme
MALPHFEDSDLFTPAEKAALKFATVMAGDHRSVCDALFDELREHFTEQQIMALGWRIAIFVGYGRLVYVTGLESVGAPCEVSFGQNSSAG